MILMTLLHRLKLVAEFKETSVSGTSGVKMQVYPFTPQFIHNVLCFDHCLLYFLY